MIRAFRLAARADRATWIVRRRSTRVAPRRRAVVVAVRDGFCRINGSDLRTVTRRRNGLTGLSRPGRPLRVRLRSAAPRVRAARLPSLAALTLHVEVVNDLRARDESSRDRPARLCW